VSPRSKPTSADLATLEGLAQLSFLVQATLARVAEAHELTTVQARLLVVLSDREPTMVVLARILALEKSSLTGLVDRAEARGLVERFTTEASRRAVQIRLTKDGRRRCVTYVNAVGPELLGLLQALTAAEKRQLGALAEQVVHEYVETHDIDVSTLDASIRFV
jgi:MarR family transcriptional regulator, lower aerobic nicotinate degradation pathway regulator